MSRRHIALLLILAALLLFTLAIQSGPALGGMGGDLFLVLYGGIWLLSWIVRGILWLIARVHRRPERASGLGLLAEVGMFAFACGLMWVRLPLRVRFALSEPALTRYADNVRRGAENPDRHPYWLGLYPIQAVRRDGQKVTLSVEVGFMEMTGFQCVPEGEPIDHPDERLSPRWYRWVEGW